MRRLPLAAVLLVAAPALALAEDPAPARELVRAALLEGAALPIAVELPGAGAGEVALPPRAAAVAGAEHEAHRRAAEHAARQAREAHPAQRGDGAGPMHGGAGGMRGMDGGTECREAAGNRRTRGMHDGSGMEPRRDDMGSTAAPLAGSAAAATAR